MADERERSIPWQTYLAAGLDAALLWSMTFVGWLLRLAYGDPAFTDVPPLARSVMGIPTAVWIVSGFLIAGAIIWKSKVLPREIASLIDSSSIIVIGILVGLAFIVLIGPLT